MAEAIGSIVGGVLQIGGGVVNAEAQFDQLLDEAAYWENQGVLEEIAGEDRLSVRRQQIRKQLGQQVAAVGKSGVTFSGSPMIALAETLENGELDLLALQRQNRAALAEIQARRDQAVKTAHYMQKTGAFGQIAAPAGAAASNITRSINQPSNSGTIDVTNRTSSTGVPAINNGRTQQVTPSRMS